jgi:excisionase family DNA binding protein
MNDNQKLGSGAKLAYSINEACSALGLGRTKLYELVSDGKIPTRRVGGRVIIAGADLVAFLEALPVTEPKRPAA